MSQAEKEKLQHEAIHNALTEIKAKGQDEPTDKTELLDFDEADAGNWEGAEEYTKYMLKTEANAKENEKKKLEPKKVEKKLNQEEIKKLKAQKAMEEDVESVEKLYNKENEKEN